MWVAQFKVQGSEVLSKRGFACCWGSSGSELQGPKDFLGVGTFSKSSMNQRGSTCERLQEMLESREMHNACSSAPTKGL